MTETYCEWVTVEFDELRTVVPVTLHAGYQKNADIFATSGRVRQFRMTSSSSETAVLTIPDRPGAEIHKLERPVRAAWVKLTIESVYAGRPYSDTAISTLLINSEQAH